MSNACKDLGILSSGIDLEVVERQSDAFVKGSNLEATTERPHNAVDVYAIVNTRNVTVTVFAKNGAAEVQVGQYVILAIAAGAPQRVCSIRGRAAQHYRVVLTTGVTGLIGQPVPLVVTLTVVAWNESNPSRRSIICSQGGPLSGTNSPLAASGVVNSLPQQGPVAVTLLAPFRIGSIVAWDSKTSAQGGGNDVLMLFDASAVPGVGSSPLLAFPLPAFGATPLSVEFGDRELEVVNGLAWAMSSTKDFLTLDAGALARVDVELV